MTWIYGIGIHLTHYFSQYGLLTATSASPLNLFQMELFSPTSDLLNNYLQLNKIQTTRQQMVLEILV
jgi:hypothetical protein